MAPPNSTGADPGAYLRTKVMTASAEELRLMLLDGAIRFAESARAGIETNDLEKSFEGVTRCQAIIMELMNGLRPEVDPELCQRLTALYAFLFSRLITAQRERDIAILDEVLQLLRYERETWAMLMEKLAAERGAAVEVKHVVTERGSLSVEG